MYNIMSRVVVLKQLTVTIVLIAIKDGMKREYRLQVS